MVLLYSCNPIFKLVFGLDIGESRYRCLIHIPTCNNNTKTHFCPCDILLYDFKPSCNMLSLLVLFVWISVVTADLTGQDPPPGTCICMTYTDVNLRDGRK